LALAQERKIVTPVLRTRTLCKSFGALTVADSVELTIESGARHALIGPNGAGKTTLINLIGGSLAPSSGTVEFLGRDVTALSEADRVKLGLGRTFQINQLFPGLSVLENVAMAVIEREGLGWSALKPLGRQTAALDESAAIVSRFGLGEVADQNVRDLSYGRQRLVEIAIGFALKPRLMLLDEPMAGVPAGETADLLASINALPDSVAVLIIEHDMDTVFRFARRITVLDQGRILVEGDPSEIARDAAVKRIYFGARGVGHG
jgi:branched-chain amino acid transport system ATP-binding protein